jgi:hypothetical protein
MRRTKTFFLILIAALAVNVYLIEILRSGRDKQFYVFGMWLLVFSIVTLLTLRKIFKERKFNVRKFISGVAPGLIFVL